MSEIQASKAEGRIDGPNFSEMGLSDLLGRIEVSDCVHADEVHALAAWVRSHLKICPL